MASEDKLQIRWPLEFEPSRCHVHVSNELEMSVPASHVWAWLVHARLWPTYYNNAHNVVFVTDTESKTLRDKTRFTWRTFDVDLESQVQEYVEGERIAWGAHGALGLNVYHAWLIVPRDEHSCYVRTEESQRGMVARMNKLMFPNKMRDQHQRWLEGLQEMSKKGLPT